MKKNSIIIVSLAIGILAVIAYYNVQTKKQGEASKLVVSKPVATHPEAPAQDGIKWKSEECKELWKKTPNFTGREEKILRDVCRIPWAHSTSEMASVIKWWKDEDGHEDMLELNFIHLVQEPDPWVNLHAIWEPLRNLALNSKFHQIRERSIVVLYDIDKKKAVPVLKEVLRMEVEVRGGKGFIYPLLRVGQYLTNEGEYEYAFPYLMKVKMFREALKKNDRRAIPYLKEALNDNDEKIKVDGALGLIQFGEEKEKTLRVLVSFLNRTKGIYQYGAYRGFAIRGLGELKDKRAIPVLEKARKYENAKLKQKDIDEAINKIMGDKTK